MKTRAFLLSLLLAVPAFAAEPDKPLVYDPEADGIRQIEAGASFCSQSGRRLVLNLGVNDCDACQVVNRAMNEKKFFEFFINDFVPVFIDVTPGSKNAEILKRWNFDPKDGLPIIVIFDKNLKPQFASRKGEMVELAKKGERDVQLWFMKHFPKNEER
jgi:thioredoxin family protein